MFHFLTDLAFSGSKTECEVGGHIKSCQHSAIAVFEGQGDVCRVWPGGVHSVGG